VRGAGIMITLLIMLVIGLGLFMIGIYDYIIGGDRTVIRPEDTELIEAIVAEIRKTKNHLTGV
jgi:hypothetical protein